MLYQKIVLIELFSAENEWNNCFFIVLLQSVTINRMKRPFFQLILYILGRLYLLFEWYFISEKIDSKKQKVTYMLLFRKLIR